MKTGSRLIKQSFIERVPEHSIPLMTAMSQSQSLQIDQYLFFHADNWLMSIAYPLLGRAEKISFQAALSKALAMTEATECYAIAPNADLLPDCQILERDRFHVLSARAQVPARLKRPVERAAELLEVSEGTEFTPGHRRLWAEFLGFGGSGGKMNARVRELYARTPQALMLCKGNLRLLDARDKDGHLVASLLLDYSPAYFVSYILGAHSRLYNVPHAMDLLFSAMLSRSGEAGKRYIHLGLGVNEGILRFKKKWGARPYLPFIMAQWRADARKVGHAVKENNDFSAARTMALALMRAPGVSGRQILDTGSPQKPFAMIWQVEKNKRVSWISGTAHFFCHSFEASFHKLFRNVDNAIFEGPLDNDFMGQVQEAGKNLPITQPSVINFLSETEIKKLEKVVLGPQGKVAASLGMAQKAKINVRHLLRRGSYWYTFFTLWTTFLERQGWRESVDMEAWRLAGQHGLNIVGMESLEEQLESLESLPIERVLNFIRSCDRWKGYSRRNMRAYLAGDLEKMMGSSAEFPTRTEHVVGRRDQRFRERMRPYLEEGRAAVFVGSAHMVNLRHMLVEDGFTVRQVPFGLWPKIHLHWRNLSRPDNKVTW